MATSLTASKNATRRKEKLLFLRNFIRSYNILIKFVD